ncbi:hypothetical protein [Nocardia africana]
MPEPHTLNRTFVGERVAQFTRTRFKGEPAGPHLNDFLATLGVTIRKPRGAIRFQRDQDGLVWHQIGRIVIHPLDHERIEVFPRIGLSDYEMDALRGSVFEVFLPDRKTWTFRTWGKRQTPVYESVIYLPN